MKRRKKSKPQRRKVKRRVTARRRLQRTVRPVEVAEVAASPAAPVDATPEEAPEVPPGWHRLTPMQQRVFQLVAAGLPTKAIAAELGTSPHTVQAHRMHIAVRLGLRGRTALQEFARHHKLGV